MNLDIQNFSYKLEEQLIYLSDTFVKLGSWFRTTNYTHLLCKHHAWILYIAVCLHCCPTCAQSAHYILAL